MSIIFCVSRFSQRDQDTKNCQLSAFLPGFSRQRRLLPNSILQTCIIWPLHIGLKCRRIEFLNSSFFQHLYFLNYNVKICLLSTISEIYQTLVDEGKHCSNENDKTACNNSRMYLKQQDITINPIFKRFHNTRFLFIISQWE